MGIGQVAMATMATTEGGIGGGGWKVGGKMNFFFINMF